MTNKRGGLQANKITDTRGGGRAHYLGGIRWQIYRSLGGTGAWRVPIQHKSGRRASEVKTETACGASTDKKWEWTYVDIVTRKGERRQGTVKKWKIIKTGHRYIR